LTPSARLQTAIELVDAIIVAARDGGASADTIAKRIFAERRYAGSKDRRAVRELAWSAIRRFGERPANARSAFVAMADEDAGLAELFDGSGYGPSIIDLKEARASGDVLPHWLLPLFSPLLDAAERAALLDRAPLDLRVNALKTDRVSVQRELPAARELSQSANALRLSTGMVVDRHPVFVSGAVEIQDLGSQFIVDDCCTEPGMKVLDLCAGAGGKTLALAAAMRNQGRIIAADTNRARLSQLPPRAARAGVTIVETRLLNPGKERAMLTDLAGQCDLVLIDAPCSGSGTWRLKRVIDEQARLLDIGAEMVAPGGHLVYAVCSLIANEGRGQMAAFLNKHCSWRAVEAGVPAGRADGDGTLLTPYHDSTDGFFFAKAQKL
jgi:16S rRNA (cytosine967-C5)-methyltransferase